MRRIKRKKEREKKKKKERKRKMIRTKLWASTMGLAVIQGEKNTKKRDGDIQLGNMHQNRHALWLMGKGDWEQTKQMPPFPTIHVLRTVPHTERTKRKQKTGFVCKRRKKEKRQRPTKKRGKGRWKEGGVARKEEGTERGRERELDGRGGRGPKDLRPSIYIWLAGPFGWIVWMDPLGHGMPCRRQTTKNRSDMDMGMQIEKKGILSPVPV